MKNNIEHNGTFKDMMKFLKPFLPKLHRWTPIEKPQWETDGGLPGSRKIRKKAKWT